MANCVKCEENGVIKEATEEIDGEWYCLNCKNTMYAEKANRENQQHIQNTQSSTDRYSNTIVEFQNLIDGFTASESEQKDDSFSAK